MIKAGKYTAALVLIVVGGLLLIDLTAGTAYSAELVRWWPALIIALGIEFLILSALHRGGERKVGIAAGSIAAAVVVSLAAIGFQYSDRINVFHFAFDGIAGDSAYSYDIGTTSIPLTGGERRVVLRNPNGNVEMKAGDVDDIRIQATVLISKLTGAEAEAIAAKSGIAYRLNGSELEIETAGEEYRVLGVRHRPRMNLVVTVPSGRKVDFELRMKNGRIDAEGISVLRDFTAETTNGHVSISRIDGNVKVETTNGIIAVEETQGDAVLETTNGKITATRIAGDVRAVTTNGTLLIEQVGGDVEAETTNGRITLTGIAGKITAETTNGPVVAESETIGGKWRLKTTNGSVTVRLPEDASFKVQGRTSGNQTTRSDFPLNARKGEISGEVNGGGAEIQISTRGKIEILHLR